MIFSFFLFSLIGFIPYIASYIGLGVNMLNLKSVYGDVLKYYSFYAVIKLFLVALILPEVEGYPVHTFIISLVISSFEFVAFHLAIRKNKKAERATLIAYWWSVLTVIVSTLFQFISNSRTYEIEVNHVIYAVSAISYLIQWSAAKNVSLSIPKQTSIFNFELKTQFIVLLLGLPQAISSFGEIKGLPAYMPDVLRVASSVILYLVSLLMCPSKQEKTKQN